MKDMRTYKEHGYTHIVAYYCNIQGCWVSVGVFKSLRSAVTFFEKCFGDYEIFTINQFSKL